MLLALRDPLFCSLNETRKGYSLLFFLAPFSLSFLLSRWNGSSNGWFFNIVERVSNELFILFLFCTTRGKLGRVERKVESKTGIL